MKRLLFLFLMCLPLMAGAQELMFKHRQKADPLTGESALTYWESRHVMLSKTDDGRYYLSINNPQHIFIDGKTKVGFYSAKGKLLMTSDDWICDKETGSVTMWLRGGYTSDSTSYCRDYVEFSDNIIDINSRWDDKHIVEPQHIYKFLTETNGYIRIVTPTYYGGTFDVKARFKK